MERGSSKGCERTTEETTGNGVDPDDVDSSASTALESRQLSEGSAIRHIQELAQLGKTLLRYARKAGVYDAIKSDPSITFDEAYVRVHGRKRFSPLIGNLFNDYSEIYRSTMAAVSRREDVIDTALSLEPNFEEFASLFEEYAMNREQEAQFETGLDSALGRPSVHCAERDRFIESELRGCSADCRALARRLVVLAQALAVERTASVRARVYSDKGGGCQAEMVMRMVERGVAPDLVAVLLGDVEVPDKRVRGFRRKQTMRQQLKVAAARTTQRATRTREAISLETRSNR